MGFIIVVFYFFVVSFDNRGDFFCPRTFLVDSTDSISRSSLLMLIQVRGISSLNILQTRSSRFKLNILSDAAERAEDGNKPS